LRRVRAVNGLSLGIDHGRTHALVGESGCGKSVTAMSVLRLLPVPPARYEGGRILYREGGRELDLLRVGAPDLRAVRGGRIAMIFQEPTTCLNPVYTIGQQIVESIRLHRGLRGSSARRLAEQTLEEVGIRDPARGLDAYPHEFSGGMRQRVMIAMALVCEPSVLLADEPTTALDVTIQAQILDLIASLKASRGIGVLLISHDLGVVAGSADVVSVMYAGRIVERASVQDLFSNPLHPYTRGLLACVPRLDSTQDRLRTVRQITNDPLQFQNIPGLGSDLRAWWPEQNPTGDGNEGGTWVAQQESDVIDVRVGPGHWIAAMPVGSVAASTGSTA